jgi:hypothetical protein
MVMDILDCKDVMLYILSFIDDVNTQVNACLTCKKWKNAADELRLMGHYWFLINKISFMYVKLLILEKWNMEAMLKAKVLIDGILETNVLPELLSPFDIVHIAADALDDRWLDNCRAASLRIYGKSLDRALIYRDKPGEKGIRSFVNVHMKATFTNYCYWYDYAKCEGSLFIDTSDTIIAPLKMKLNHIKKLHIDAYDIANRLPDMPELEELTLISRRCLAEKTTILMSLPYFGSKYKLRNLKLRGVRFKDWSMFTQQLSYVWTDYDVDDSVKKMFPDAVFTRYY